MAEQPADQSGTPKQTSSGGFLALQDSYDRYARLAPALLTMLPIAVALTAIPTGDADWLKPIVGVASAFGATVLLAAIARSAGRAAEDEVFTDGMPTLQRLRHRGPLTSAERAELHTSVSKATAVTLPTAQIEAEDPVESDGVYRIAVSKLIAASRDQDRFELLHKENRNYGFLRNLLGLRSIGRMLALAALAAGIVLLVIALVRGDVLDAVLAGASIVVSSIAVAVFYLWIGPSRLSVPATAYADRLFEAARDLVDS